MYRIRQLFGTAGAALGQDGVGVRRRLGQDGVGIRRRLGQDGVGIRRPLYTVEAMNESPLMAFLRDMKAREEDAERASAATRSEWLTELEQLFAWLRRLLEPAVREGLALVETASTVVEKDAIGDYVAPALKVTLPGPHVVWVRPIGTFSVGARGMVDVVCGANRALLVLNRAGSWKVRGGQSSTEGGKLEPLDDLRFTKVLEELVR
jgi:hypothetical protein